MEQDSVIKDQIMERDLDSNVIFPVNERVSEPIYTELTTKRRIQESDKKRLLVDNVENDGIQKLDFPSRGTKCSP